MFLLWGQANELNGLQRSTDCPTRMQRLKLQKKGVVSTMAFNGIR